MLGFVKVGQHGLLGVAPPFTGHMSSVCPYVTKRPSHIFDTPTLHSHSDGGGGRVAGEAGIGPALSGSKPDVLPFTLLPTQSKKLFSDPFRIDWRDRLGHFSGCGPLHPHNLGPFCSHALP